MTTCGVAVISLFWLLAQHHPTQSSLRANTFGTNGKTGYMLKQEVLQLLAVALAMGLCGLSGPVDDMEGVECLHWLAMEFVDTRDLWLGALSPLPSWPEEGPLL